jgi:mannose-6-phosphate isomerase-like protein (cupin superfamily)
VSSPVHIHRKLPDTWALLCGREPKDAFGLKSDRLQIIYNNTDISWADSGPHAHSESDEVYIVIEGEMTVDVAGNVVAVGAGEYLCVPAGTFHHLVAVRPPVKSFVIRGPSINDKVEVGA